ncbi:AIR carboxylase family protein [Vibrio chagasii]|nr:AIR carboxylase family protein [Vibrio chagasii]
MAYETKGFQLTAHLSCLQTTQPVRKERGIKVIIAGAGGAAHLPGMAAASQAYLFLGVPVWGPALKGMDSAFYRANAKRHRGRYSSYRKKREQRTLAS